MRESGSANYFNVKDFGALGDGTGAPAGGGSGDTKDTKAVKDAIRASEPQGGVLFFPPGRYVLSSTIDIRRPMRVEGSGAQATLILVNKTGIDLFVARSQNVSFSDLAISSLSQQTGGAFIRYMPPVNGPPPTTAGFAYVKNFLLYNAFKGIQLTGNVPSIRISDGDILNFSGIGVSIETDPDSDPPGAGGLDVYLRAVGMANSYRNRPAPADRQPAAGIYIQDTGDVFISDCDLIACGQALYIEGGSGIYAQNTFFDSSRHGIRVLAKKPFLNNHFLGCGTTNCTVAGVLIEASSPARVADVEFNGLQCVGQDVLNGGTAPEKGVSLGKGENIKVVNSNIRNFGNARGGFGLGLGAGVRACLVSGNTIYDPRPIDAIYSVFARFSAEPGRESFHSFTNNFWKANVNNLPSPRGPMDPSPLQAYGSLMANNVILPPGMGR